MHLISITLAALLAVSGQVAAGTPSSGIVEAALKPGGTLLIVDHAAKDGSGKNAAQDLHRIDEALRTARA